MNLQTINITGTHCQACKKLIEKRIMAISGVDKVDVDYLTGKTQITADNEITKDKIAKALEGMPYEIQ